MLLKCQDAEQGPRATRFDRGELGQVVRLADTPGRCCRGVSPRSSSRASHQSWTRSFASPSSRAKDCRSNTRTLTPSRTSQLALLVQLEDAWFARLAEKAVGKRARGVGLFSFATSLTGIACNNRESNSPCVSILLVIDRRSSRAMNSLLPLSPNWRSSAEPGLHQLENALMQLAA